MQQLLKRKWEKWIFLFFKQNIKEFNPISKLKLIFPKTMILRIKKPIEIVQTQINNKLIKNKVIMLFMKDYDSLEVNYKKKKRKIN